MSNNVKFEKLGRKCRITLSNKSETDECTTSYRISVYDSDDERWEDHANTTTTLKPKTSHSQEYHKWSATDWDYTVTNNYCE